MERRWLNLRKGLLRSILPVVRLLPPRAASRFVASIGRAEYSRVPTVRIRVDAAVTRWGHHLGHRWDVAAVGGELAANQVRSRTRDLLLDGLTDHQVAGLFEVSGRDALDDALAEGRGAILLGNHFGADLMPAHWLIRHRFEYRMLAEKPRHVSGVLSRHFEIGGPLGQDKLFLSRSATPSETALAFLRATRILDAGMIVHIAGDVRWAGPNTTEAEFLGRTHSFTTTWVTLAALTGAPVVPVFCRMDRAGAYHLEFLEPFTVPADAQRPGRARPWVRRNLLLIEERVRRYPCNSNDYLFWDEAGDARTPDGALQPAG
jgi:phosphatidylinositol dimannoside acyltransferase